MRHVHYKKDIIKLCINDRYYCNRRNQLIYAVKKIDDRYSAAFSVDLPQLYVTNYY